MSVPFDLALPTVMVEARVVGPRRAITVKLALDTGATQTTIRPHLLTAAGYTPSEAGRHVRMRTVTGGGTAPVVTVSGITALERVRINFPVVAHDPPPAVTVDGLLGLDFFRRLVLTVDFARGLISLDPPRPWWQFWR